MPLDVPAGTTVFIDANILHYALVPTPPFSDHVDRIAAGDVMGAVSLQVLAETQHKKSLTWRRMTMISSACLESGSGSRARDVPKPQVTANRQNLPTSFPVFPSFRLPHSGPIGHIHVCTAGRLRSPLLSG
jgi:hypothetical protein